MSDTIYNEPRCELSLALTWSAVCCHVAVTGAIAIIAAVDAAVLVIGICVRPIVWQPQLVERLPHAEEARSAMRKSTALSIKTCCLPRKSHMKRVWGGCIQVIGLQQADTSP